MKSKSTSTLKNLPLNAAQLKQLGLAVIRAEADAVSALSQRIDASFVEACHHLHACQGRIVVLGMGKSGHIGSKIAATLASTGSPAFFVHPGEASHGDLGMITPNDVVLALSNSGETEEILIILPIIRRLGVPLIALTGNFRSTLAREASVHIDVSIEREACPLGLAPTASTTAALAMGDALAIALLETHGFTAEDFARSHPGGRLGRRLLLHVGDIMHQGDEIPAVKAEMPLADALLEITRKGLGMAIIVDDQHRVLGVFTDGDLRRTLNQGHDIHRIVIGNVMTSPYRSAHPNLLAVEAVKLMEDNCINALPVINDKNHLVGALNMQDLLRAGVV